MVHFHYSKDREKKLDAGGYPLIFQAMGGLGILGASLIILGVPWTPEETMHYRRPLPSSITGVHYRHRRRFLRFRS